MPGMYAEGDYDLAGFCVGVVERDRIIDGTRTRAGDAVIGLASSGPHSNGYSLIRRLLAETRADGSTEVAGARLIGQLMAPTRIYVKPMLSLAAALDVHGIAHITGGGLTDNVPRVLPEGLGVRLDPRSWRRSPVWEWIQSSGRISDGEMHRTFNCGIGMVVVVARDDADAALTRLTAAGERATLIGEVVTGAGVQFG
jgi:phosphoribosylformylglycinamidine cyclo-ligase